MNEGVCVCVACFFYRAGIYSEIHICGGVVFGGMGRKVEGEWLSITARMPRVYPGRIETKRVDGDS